MNWLRNFLRKYLGPQGRYGEYQPKSVDYFNRQKNPTAYDLIDNFKRTSYACATINANGCSNIPLRLYVKTREGEKSPRVRAKSLTKQNLCRLEKTYSEVFRKELKNVEEVVDHPVLDLLERFNESPFINGEIAKTLTFLYQEVTGNSYWLIEDGILGPENIYLLPSQCVTPKTYINSKNIIDYYEYKTDSSQPPEKYSPEEIIQYLSLGLRNPYVTGYSPELACYEANLVTNKLTSLESSILDNQGRPEILINPGKDTAFSPEEVVRLEQKLQNKYGRGKNGGFYVAEEQIEFKPINYPPKDLAAFEIQTQGKHEIANTFGVPIALIDSRGINKATLEAALEQHARLTIFPRLKRDAAIKNDRLLSRYDDTNRLFFAYDDPVPENREILLQETVQLKMNAIITGNEARDKYDYPPLPGEDKLVPINQPANANSNTKRDNARSVGTAKK